MLAQLLSFCPIHNKTVSAYNCMHFHKIGKFHEQWLMMGTYNLPRRLVDGSSTCSNRKGNKSDGALDSREHRVVVGFVGFV